MNHLLTQGPGLALEILLELNKLIDGENCKTDEDMDARGEIASSALITMLGKKSKEEVFTLLASMATVETVSKFLYDDILDYIEKKWGLTEVFDAVRN